MKIKITYIVLSLLVLLTGCAKHSNPDPEVLTGRYIFFDAGLPQTKGTLESSETFLKTEGTAFGVFGYRLSNVPVFDLYSISADGVFESPYNNVAKVYRPSGTGPVTYDGLAQWTTGSHNFYAYYPYESNPSMITVNTDATDPYITYNQPTTLDDMVDVMTASTGEITIANTTSSSGVIDLAFDHRLFALNVVIKNQQVDSEESIKLTSASVAFTNIASAAIMYFDGNTNGSETTTLSHTYTIEANEQVIDYNDELNLNGENSDNTPFLFIPCTSLAVSLTLGLVNSWGETVTLQPTLTATPSGGFLAGHTYALIIKKVDKEVGFVYDLVDDWQVKEGDDMNMGFN